MCTHYHCATQYTAETQVLPYHCWEGTTHYVCMYANASYLQCKWMYIVRIHLWYDIMSTHDIYHHP